MLLDRDLSSEDKVNLLGLKLEWLLTSEYVGKKKYIILALLSILTTVLISVNGGLAIVIDALYQLFQSGKLRRITLDSASECPS